LYAYQTKFAAANVTWVNDLIPETQMPLTFEAIEAGATVTYAITSGDLPTIKYSTDGITWTTYTDPITLANAGDKVYFYGHNSTYRRNGQSAKFQCSADCYLYGNIMSLVNEADFSTQTALGDYAFYGMFGSNTHIKNHPTLDIILPAATMHQYCYAYMFHGCTGLTRVPDLPSTNLAHDCYNCMFGDCTGLTSIPEDLLPATTMSDRCYQYMFSGCTGLTRAPELPAANLANYCYQNMFYGCTNLSSVTCYATYRSDEDVTQNWLYNVAESGTLYAPSNSIFADDAHGPSAIPVGWNMKDIMYTQPLTFEAMEDGATVTYSVSAGDLPAVEYSTDGSTWTAYSDPVTLAHAGDKVYFRGTHDTYKNSAGNNARFSCSDDCYIYGNIMSLVNKTDFAATTTFGAGDRNFSRMFSGNTHLKNHPSKDLVLPATVMRSESYSYMFNGCTGLTRVPALPAMSLAPSCYESMFYNCTGLTSVPEDLLPATTLSESCYNSMFQSCTNLTEAPALLAAQIPPSAYANMFYGCSNLTKVTCTATYRQNENSNHNWLSNTAEHGTLYTTLESVFVNLAIGEGNSSIPTGWIKAFIIPANEDPENPGVYYTTFYHSMHNCALQDDGTEAYAATLNGDAMLLTKIAEGSQVIPEGTGVILKTTSNPFILKTTLEPGVTVSANSLEGTIVKKSAPMYCYVLSGHSTDNTVTGVGFYRYEYGADLKAHKAYMVYSVSGNAPKKLRFVFRNENTATGVENANLKSEIKNQKFIKDGRLIIIRNGVEYNAAGQIIK
jgi:hypothetical protein